MNSFLDWLGKHKVSTHVIAVLMLGLITIFNGDKPFHDLVTGLWTKLPNWASVLLVAAWQLYSWYRNGQQTPTGQQNGPTPIAITSATAGLRPGSGGSVSKMGLAAMTKKALEHPARSAGYLAAVVSLGILCAMPIAGGMVLTGCSASQVIAGIQDVESKLPEIAQIAGGVLLEVAPEYAPFVAPVTAGLQTVGNALIDAITAYKSNPSASLLAKINSLVQQGLTHTQALATVSQIKDPESLGYVQTAAGLIGLIFNDAASWAQHTPAAVVSRLPALFGWHIAGVDLIASDGSTLPTPVQGKTKHSNLTARDIAAHWNKVCKHEQAKIHEARKHFLGIPIPGTGHK